MGGPVIPLWLIVFGLFWFMGSMMAVSVIAWFAEKNPMGISAKIVKLLGGGKRDEWEEIKSPAVLSQQPDGVVIEDANGIVLERFEGRWINSRGRVQVRIGLPARIVPDTRS